MTATAAEPIDHIQAIYRHAVRISRAARARVRADLGGTFSRPKPCDHRPAQQAGGSPDPLATAGKSLVALAAPDARPFVRRAVNNLLAAVAELAGYQPEYTPAVHEMSAERAREYNLADGPMLFTTWAPTPASVARLDELRARVRVRLIECEELFEWHDTPASRLLTVMRRAAGVLLEPTAAALVGEWLTNLERGGGQ